MAEATFLAEAGFREIRALQRVLQAEGLDAFLVRPSGAGNT